MKAWLLTVLPVILSCVFCIACKENDEDYAEAAGRTKIQMTFALDLGKVASRATWENPPYHEMDYGNNYEKIIDWTKLHILVYSADGNAYWGKMSNIVCLEEIGYTYRFSGELNLDKSYLTNNTLNCRIMVFANSETTVEDVLLGNLTYNQNTPNIPMWGVKTINIPVVDGCADLGENQIDLLRAMAKVVVTKNKDLTGYTFVSVSFDHYNSNGYFMPADYAEVSDTKNVSVGYHIPKEPSPATDLAFAYEKNDRYEDFNDRYVIYVPEYINNGALNPSSISVTLRKGTGTELQTYKIEFKEYTDGKPGGTILDIKRNHIYTFHIKSIIEPAESGDIKVDVRTKVAEWRVIDVGPEYE